MSRTAAFIALVETASREGVESRRRYLKEHGPHEMGWSYANILEVEPLLQRQLKVKGFFRTYLYLPEPEKAVPFALKVTALRTYAKRQLFQDPVDGRMYLVHSRMTIQSIEQVHPPLVLGDFVSIDIRKPDTRYLELGFLFVVDPEV